MAKNRLKITSIIIIGAVFIDLIIGDPKKIIHPVQVIGWVVNLLKNSIYFIAKDNILALRLGGVLITILVVSISGCTGWLIEQISLKQSAIPLLISNLFLAIALSSSLAYKSLKNGVLNVLKCLENKSGNKKIETARRALKEIVGRDVNNLKEDQILRATAETASENSIDGVFSPLFWIFIGTMSWKFSLSAPGPLAFALAFKASSTLDSMIGYRTGKLKWLGESSARLDDCLNFVPCRVVLVTLPLISEKWNSYFSIIKKALNESKDYLSPNAGLSEAIFANCANTKMGGDNYYNKKIISKPILGKEYPSANKKNIKTILNLTLRLEIIWTLIIVLIIYFA